MSLGEMSSTIIHVIVEGLGQKEEKNKEKAHWCTHLPWIDVKIMLKESALIGREVLSYMPFWKLLPFEMKWNDFVIIKRRLKELVEPLALIFGYGKIGEGYPSTKNVKNAGFKKKNEFFRILFLKRFLNLILKN